jgi:hypothetical protein
MLQEAGLTVAQVQGEEEIEVHEGAIKWPYAPGATLVWPELVDHLPTRMYAFHNWYMKYTASGIAYLEVAIDDHHYFRGRTTFNVPVEEFWFLFNQDALDVSLISCWCL